MPLFKLFLIEMMGLINEPIIPPQIKPIKMLETNELCKSVFNR